MLTDKCKSQNKEITEEEHVYESQRGPDRSAYEYIHHNLSNRRRLYRARLTDGQVPLLNASSPNVEWVVILISSRASKLLRKILKLCSIRNKSELESLLY